MAAKHYSSSFSGNLVQAFLCIDNSLHNPVCVSRKPGRYSHSLLIWTYLKYILDRDSHWNIKKESKQK